MKIIKIGCIILIVVLVVLGFKNQKNFIETSPQDIYETIETCLDSMSFSKQTLSSVLLVEGFTQKEINKAFSSLNINWKEQAKLKAEQYLSLINLSEDGLREQLKCEGFNDEEINYAIKNIYLKE